MIKTFEDLNIEARELGMAQMRIKIVSAGSHSSDASLRRMCVGLASQRLNGPWSVAGQVDHMRPAMTQLPQALFVQKPSVTTAIRQIPNRPVYYTVLDRVLAKCSAGVSSMAVHRFSDSPSANYADLRLISLITSPFSRAVRLTSRTYNTVTLFCSLECIHDQQILKHNVFCRLQTSDHQPCWT